MIVAHPFMSAIFFPRPNIKAAAHTNPHSISTEMTMFLNP
jgi:hypothetical protein